jgi:hypothetical protein
MRISIITLTTFTLGTLLLPLTIPAICLSVTVPGRDGKWAATALHLGVHPWCVVTSDPREFDRYLPSA